MEKQRTNSINKFCRRLLTGILSLVLCNSFYAEELTPEHINNLIIIPSTTSELYSDAEIHFEVFGKQLKHQLISSFASIVKKFRTKEANKKETN